VAASPSDAEFEGVLPLRCRRRKESAGGPIEERLRGLQGLIDLLAEELQILAFAFLMPGLVGTARDLVQRSIQFGRICCEPLQVIVIEHERIFPLRFIFVVPTRPPNTTDQRANNKKKRADGEHDSEEK
jgi:hypothetical protein